MYWAGSPGILKIISFLPLLPPLLILVRFFFLNHNSRSLTKIPLIVSPAPGVSFYVVAIAVSSWLISMGFSQMEEE